MNDTRLEWERILKTFTIQRSIQFKNNSKMPLDTELKVCKTQNSMSTNKTLYKQYILYYGYKFEDPKKIYKIDQNKRH